MSNTDLNFHLPTIALTPVDLINRRAAATGSVSTAMASEGANYNGHALRVEFLRHVSGPTWVARYIWAGTQTIARGSLATCIRAAREFYARGDRGTSVSMRTDEQAPESLKEQLELLGGFTCGVEDRQKPAYWTDRHEIVVQAMRLHRNTGAALAFEGTPEEYYALAMGGKV